VEVLISDLWRYFLGSANRRAAAVWRHQQIPRKRPGELREI